MIWSATKEGWRSSGIGRCATLQVSGRPFDTSLLFSADCTDRKIIDTIPNNRPPQVTFSCSNDGPSSNLTRSGWSHALISPLVSEDDSGEIAEKETGQCMFQFWVDRIESFYCQLDGCRWDASESYSQCSATRP